MLKTVHVNLIFCNLVYGHMLLEHCLHGVGFASAIKVGEDIDSDQGSVCQSNTSILSSLNFTIFLNTNLNIKLHIILILVIFSLLKVF
jgi:hypothetical protein